MSIQIDNGDFTRIHNDILDGLAKARFSALELRCVIFLVRMTYGWQKKEDKISLSQWAIGIGIDKSNRGNMLNTLNGLVAKGVIYARPNGKSRPATWGLNKDFFDKQSVMQPHNTLEDEAEPSVMQPHNTTVMQPHNTLPKSVMQPHNHKRKILKKDKETPRARSRSGDVHPGTQAIMEAYIEVLGYKPGNYPQESAAAKKLAKDGYEPVDVVAAYQLLKQQAFWQTKHLSLQTLVKEIPALKQALLKGVAPPNAPKAKGINGYRDMLAQQGIDL